MPIWLRKFTLNKIVSHYTAQNEQQTKSDNNNIDLANPDKSKLPSNAIQPPSYVTKANRKKT